MACFVSSKACAKFLQLAASNCRHSGSIRVVVWPSEDRSAQMPPCRATEDATNHCVPISPGGDSGLPVPVAHRQQADGL
eukprot:48059-Eustigmatos_ZCMA.PRE.1